MRAAVIYRPGTPLELEDVTLDDPHAGEVRVRLRAVGVCHSDYHYMVGDIPCPLPIVLGHEGTGEVVAVGYPLEAVNEAYPDLVAGSVGRSIILPNG